MAEVTLEDVTKIYGEDILAVDKMNLDIPDGEFVVFVGPSGCGKSTALRMIAGLEDISSGKLFIGDNVVNELPPRDRDIAMVFQNYALYPHMNVRENMGFALKLRKMEKSQIEARVDNAAKILSIESYLDRKPKALSGGQRQRVALGRAIVREPKCFLMDEPLSNLDAKLRVQMRTEIAKLHSRLGVTTIYVTHDQTEAMTMADRIVVLKDGVVQQIDHPQDMYNDPKNIFVAGFIGSPAMNFVRARLENKDGGMVATFSGTTVPISREIIGKAKETEKDPESYAGKEVILGIRPEHIEDASVEDAPQILNGNTLEVKPQVIESMGSEKYLYFEVPGDATGGSSTGQSSAGDEDVEFEDMMVARVSASSQAHVGQGSRLVIDSSKIRLFDAETEQAIL